MANEIQTLITDFAGRIAAIVEGQTLDRLRRSMLGAFGSEEPRRRGRPPKSVDAKAHAVVITKPRKKAPLQLCPVPGCRNPAAPVFGMVCGKHKDLSKAKIKAYREARRAKKAAAKN